MPDDVAVKKGWSIDIDTLKSWATIAGVVTTLLGVINFGTSKINLYDGYAPRIAKLEARDQAVNALSDADKAMNFQIQSQTNDLNGLKTRMDNLSSDVIQLRLSTERLRALLENHK